MRRRRARGNSELSEFRRAFWAFYAESFPKDASLFGWRRGYARSYAWFQSAHPGIIVSLYLAQREVGIYCTSPWGAPQRDVFPNLEGYEEVMRRELGVEVGKAKDLYGAPRVRRGNTRDRSEWESMAGWMHEQLEAYLEVLGRGPTQ